MNSDPSVVNHAKKNISSLSLDILKSVLNNVQEGIVLIDLNGCILDINPEGIALHGLHHSKKEDFVNKSYSLFNVADNNRRELAESEWPVARILAGETFTNVPLVVKIRENSPEISLSYSGIPQFTEEGEFICGILFIRKTRDPETLVDPALDVDVKVEAIHEHEFYQQQLKDERELLHTIIDTIPVMVTIYDKRIHSFTMNRAFENITGWTSSDLQKSNIMELVYPDPEYRQQIVNYMQSLGPGFKDIVMRTRDGRNIATSWANVKIPDGRQVGVGIDISERKNLEKELILARERAEHESHVQHAFIQNISHEVRTPMNSILGFTELLQKEVKREKEIEFLYAISQNGKQLLRLIDDIIDVSQLDNNQISLQREPVVAGEFIRRIQLQLAGIKKAYKKRHLNIILEKPGDDVKVVLNTDTLRLQQVLLNLISNAVKYTEEGTITIAFEIREEEQDMLFSVKDTGIGINDDEKQNVFKRFNRLHNTKSRELRGTGLGLAICKHLVKLMGGNIWFDSEFGKGTAFYFNHPYLELERVKVKPVIPFIDKDRQAADFSLPELNDKVILIVEDDSFSYMMMYHMLEETKALILHADSGTKAVEIFNKYKTDLVFLDIRIPEMDGYEVIRYIHESDKSVPVIAQTANALPNDRKKIEKAGFDYHITKPLSRDTLYSVLNKFL